MSFNRPNKRRESTRRAASEPQLMKRQTKQKGVVQRVFINSTRPLSPQEVFEAARTELKSISLATVYRSLRSLHQDGEIVPVSLPGAADRYESRSCAESHHHHFLCDGCGRLFDIPGCGLRASTHALPPGFLVARHEVTLFGSCNQCAADPRSV
jgi:Fur family ferric uptake transcriptional regulator